MSDWQRLQRLFEEVAGARQEAEAREQRRAQARHELEAWYERVEPELMQELHTALEEGARELQTPQAKVDVKAPTVHALRIGAGEFRRSLQLTLMAAEVLVYSARAQPGPLMVHWARVVHSSGRHCPRVLSVPGFRVRRGVAGNMVLDPLGPQAFAGPFSISEVALRVLTMLVEQAAVSGHRYQLPRAT